MKNRMPTQIYAKIFIENMCNLTYTGTKNQIQYIPYIDYEFKDDVFVTKDDILPGMFEFFDKESDYEEYNPVLMDGFFNLPYYMRRIF
jgi:hypothetical protein